MIETTRWPAKENKDERVYDGSIAMGGNGLIYGMLSGLVVGMFIKKEKE